MNSSVSTQALPPHTPGRPMGLVLSAIVLALMTCVGLISGVSVIFTAVFIRTPQLAQYPVVEAFQIGVGIVILIISGFCAWTVVGLCRIRRWARISILILGGLLAFFSLLFVLVMCVLAFTSLAPPPGTPGVSPAMMRVIFLGAGGFYLLLMLVGIWWLVYFNLHRIRTLFAANGARPQPESAFQAGMPVVGVWIDPNTPKRGAIEILVICLAVLYLFSATSGIVTAFLHFPLFFMGFIFRGTSASVAALFFSAISLGMGIGLLRRIKAAWVTTLAFNALGLVSTLLMLTPRNRAMMADYQQEILRHMFSGAVPFPSPSQFNPASTFFLGAVVGVLMVGAVFWLLFKARPLFERKGMAS